MSENATFDFDEWLETGTVAQRTVILHPHETVRSISRTVYSWPQYEQR